MKTTIISAEQYRRNLISGLGLAALGVLALGCIVVSVIIELRLTP